MARMVRMGARVSIADGQAPLGCGTPRVATQDENGREVVREERGPDSTEFDVVPFVDLDDGRRVITRELGGMTLSMPLEDCSAEELRAEVRECVYEDEEREILELPEEPRWDDMEAVLRAHGVVSDDRSLAALPFVVEFDDELLALLDPHLC